MKKRIFITTLICGLFLIVAVTLAASNRGATLTISNDSLQRMEGVTIELVGYGKREVGDISPGKKAKAHFADYSDSAWDLKVDSHFGRPMRERFGYVTHGLNFDDRITIDSTGKIDFQSTGWSIFPPIKTIFGL